MGGEVQMTTQIWMVVGAYLFIAIGLAWGKKEPCLIIMLALAFLWVTGILDTATAFGQFAGDVIIIMIFMMMCSAGLMKTDILFHITNFIKKVHGGQKTLFAVAMITPFILCQFMGGVTSLMTTVPLLIGLADANKIPRTRLVLPALCGSQFGIGLFPIGLSVGLYMQKNEFLAALGSTYRMGFWDIMLTRLPGVIASMLFVIFIGYKFLPVAPGRGKTDIPEGEAEVKRSTLPKWKSAAAYIIFIAVLFAMIFNRQLGLSMGQIPFVGALCYLVLGILPFDEAFAFVNWPLCFMVAFCVAISTALSTSGAADLIAVYAGKIITGDTSMVLLCIAIFVFCNVITQFFDNNSLIYIMMPIVIAACNGVGLSPLPLIACIDLSSMASIMTPLAGPGPLMAYNMGGYSFKDMIKFGVPVVVVQCLVSALWVPFYFGVL